MSHRVPLLFTQLPVLADSRVKGLNVEVAVDPSTRSIFLLTKSTTIPPTPLPSHPPRFSRLIGSARVRVKRLGKMLGVMFAVNGYTYSNSYSQPF